MENCHFSSRLFALTALSLLWPGNLAGAEPNVLTQDEAAAGFALLFNGRNLDGWNSDGDWEVKDGAIAWMKEGSSLEYKAAKMPADFELRFEWKISPRGNSGIFYRPGRFEYQILDNKAHGDGINPRTSAGALYFCIAPTRDVTKPAGEWNTGRIVCKGTVIQHWMNGEKIIDFDFASPQRAPDMERLKNLGRQLTAPESFPWLQNHGDPAWFRSIRMRAIPEDEDIGHTPLEPSPIPAEALKKEKAILDRIRAMREAQMKALRGK